MTHEEKLAELERELAKQDEAWERIQRGFAELGEEPIEVPPEVFHWLEQLRACAPPPEPVLGWMIRA